MAGEIIAAFSEEGMRLLREHLVVLKGGGLRWPDGRLFELPSFVKVPSAGDSAAHFPAVQEALAAMSAQSSAFQKEWKNNFQTLHLADMQIQALSSINIGLSALDLAASVAGFTLLFCKLDKLDGEIQKIDSTIDALYKEVSLTRREASFKYFLTRLKNDLIAFDEMATPQAKNDYYRQYGRDIQNLLGDLKEYLLHVKKWFEADDLPLEKRSAAFNTLLTLLPLYSDEIIHVCQCHANLYGHLPTQYSDWVLVFSDLSERAFQEGLKKLLAFGAPRLSPVQKANARDTINWNICNILKSQVTAVQVVQYLAENSLDCQSEPSITPVSIDSLSSDLAVT